MMNKLFLIKFIHSLIFWWQIACLGWLIYAAIAPNFGIITILAVASILINGIALLANHGRCPFTTLAEKEGAQSGSVTDIFLPDIIARNIFRCSTPLFVIEVIALAIRYFAGI